jgi:methyltransferase
VLEAIALLAMVFVPMLVEAGRAARNERVQRARGGLEPSGDVYNVMRIAYPTVFLAMIAEGVWRNARPPVAHLDLDAGIAAASFAVSEIALLGFGLFLGAKALKWWAILSLGRAWTFRVIVVPGDAPVARGPYAFLRHPNYVAVAGELVSVALMAGAPVSGAIGTLAFCALMLKRIRVEERALEQARRAR